MTAEQKFKISLYNTGVIGAESNDAIESEFGKFDAYDETRQLLTGAKVVGSARNDGGSVDLLLAEEHDEQDVEGLFA